MSHTMKKIPVLLIVIIFGVAIFSPFVFTQPVHAQLPAPENQKITPIGPEMPQPEETQVPGAVHALYFYSNDCPHCLAVLNELILPMQSELGEMLDIRLLDISVPEYYEAMLLIEDAFSIGASQRSIPTLIIADQILIGETDIRGQFPKRVTQGLDAGGISFPQIEGIDPKSLISVAPGDLIGDELCDTEENCVVEAPIFAAYFYQTGCKECSRVEADIYYLRTQYPQLQVVEFNIFDHADLAEWLTARIDPERSFQSPALFIGETFLFGDEILPERIISILEQYRDTGADPVWLDYDPESGRESIITRFTEMGWLAVVAAGLVDGINPCAFATLIFFVSYLTVSGRKGNEVLAVGGAFTLGVFLAYLAIGLGLYQILELVGGTLDLIAQIVYLLTAVFCLVLAVLSFLDYRKAKAGNVGDMLLKLPEPLRKRINATIRKGRDARRYVLGAFGVGLLISLLELACTGQVYLPTIIFVSSIPGLRLQAFFYLLLYNLLFILPLVIIFVLVYFGTTSKELTHFLQKKAALVKFAMGILFVALAVWLIASLFL